MSNPLDEKEGFFHRWSRLKRQETSADAGNMPGTEAHPAVRVPDEPAGGRVLTDADMPAIDSLNEHSDFSGFLSSKVSEELRRAALRKLFHLPTFNLTDGLDDYDEDFTRPAKLVDWVGRRGLSRDVTQDKSATVPHSEVPLEDSGVDAESVAAEDDAETEQPSVSRLTDAAGKATGPSDVATSRGDPKMHNQT